MKRLLAAVSLVLSPALASADAFSALRAMAGGVEIPVPMVQQGKPAHVIAAGPQSTATRVDASKEDVSGEGSVVGSVMEHPAMGHGKIGGGPAIEARSVPVEGEIVVNGPDGSSGRIKVYGSVQLFGGANIENTAFVGGSGTLYKDGKAVGTVDLHGRGSASVMRGGGAFTRATAVVKVSGVFKPAN